MPLQLSCYFAVGKVSYFAVDFVNFGRDRGLLLNLTHLRDDSSPETWNYSVWVRGYALCLEERVECFNALKYDVDKDQSRNRRLNTPDLLDQLPVLQELLHHLLNCKYFEMQHYHAVRALEIYRKAGEQVSLLSEFFEICRGLHYGQGQKYLKIKPLPESFLIAMEEYVKETPEVLALPYTSITKDEGAAPTETPAPVTDLLTDDVKKNLLHLRIKPRCFDEPSEEGTELNENNPLALAIVKSENPPYAENVGSSAPAFTGWELGPCDAPVSNGAAVADNKMTGSSNRLTPHSLSTTNQQMAYNFDQVSANPFDDYNSQGPFYGSSSVLPEANVQTAAMPQQLPYIMPQQPPMTMVAYHSISPSAVANYNQIPTFYGGSNFTLSTDMKMAVIAPQQTDLKQQPTLAMVGYNSTKPSGNPFDM
ncbi:ENTH/ANTH/VHS superfamily protein [Gossypium australe]|uniref:ENTH/ANTH/VHS superfamily protein n=1 Tax=Gossypium australe TaxID=47621 RepID=A0A5B6V4U0_9ROSI|nr:ENTH/ANTH/VHS superfamily protein [Gossypium australe]